MDEAYGGAQEIRKILERSGSSWSESERWNVYHYYSQGPGRGLIRHVLKGRLGKYEHHVEDVIQDFLASRFLAVCSQFSPEKASFGTWLSRCMCNFAESQRRKFQRWSATSLDKSIGDEGEGSEEITGHDVIADNASDPLESTIQNKIRSALKDCVDELNERDRGLFILYHFKRPDLTLKEAGTEFGIEETSVGKTHTRVLAKLKKCLKRKGYGTDE